MGKCRLAACSLQSAGWGKRCVGCRMRLAKISASSEDGTCAAIAPHPFSVPNCCVRCTPHSLPAVEVPLDGTVYELATGKVLSWCPKNTVVSWFTQLECIQLLGAGWWARLPACLLSCNMLPAEATLERQSGLAVATLTHRAPLVPTLSSPAPPQVRKVLGGLKDKSEPVDLPVYPVQVGSAYSLGLALWVWR